MGRDKPGMAASSDLARQGWMLERRHWSWLIGVMTCLSPHSQGHGIHHTIIQHTGCSRIVVNVCRFTSQGKLVNIAIDCETMFSQFNQELCRQILPRHCRSMQWPGAADDCHAVLHWHQLVTGVMCHGTSQKWSYNHQTFLVSWSLQSYTILIQS